MSYNNLPYIVEVRIIYGSDNRRKIQFTPWKNIENEIDDCGNINLFSKELTKLIPSTKNGEDCEIYFAKLVKKPVVRSEYIRHLIREFECTTYQDYCEKTFTPPPKLEQMFIFDRLASNINKDIDEIITQSISTKQFKTKSAKRTKEISTRTVSSTSNA